MHPETSGWLNVIDFAHNTRVYEPWKTRQCMNTNRTDKWKHGQQFTRTHTHTDTHTPTPHDGRGGNPTTAPTFRGSTSSIKPACWTSIGRSIAFTITYRGASATTYRVKKKGVKNEKKCDWLMAYTAGKSRRTDAILG